MVLVGWADGPAHCGAVVVAVLDRSRWARCSRYRAWQLVQSGHNWKIARERIVRVRGVRQRGGLDESLSWQLVPSGRDWMVAWGSAVSESGHPVTVSEAGWSGAWVSTGWPEGSRGPGAPGGAARAVALLIPNGWVKGRHYQRTWGGLKIWLGR